MKILIINSGSSSLKYALYQMENEQCVYENLIENIGEEEGVATHKEALELMLQTLKGRDVLEDISQLDGVGHRVVHGGPYFSDSVIVDAEVKKRIHECIRLAPLHNGANLEGILALEALAPKLKQVAVFDTAFHQTLPPKAYMYALPYTLFEQEHIRRYGFHGTSHAYVMKVAAHFLKKEVAHFNAISFHLGNGASVCAIQNGKSVDTSMGFSPLEGLMMGTRSGDIDADIVIYLQKEMGMSADEVTTLLNKKSGLQGIAGENDMRQILQKKAQGDVLATLAFEMFIYRIRKYLGAYAIALGKVDALLFTGGIGEHSDTVRDAVLEGLQGVLGVVLNGMKVKKLPALISDESSRIAVCVIETNEALEIAKASQKLLS